MKVSLRWLAEFIDLPTDDPDVLADVFASLGHEVEGVERLAVDFRGVRTAEVLDVVRHPNADRLRLCTVTTGGDPVEVVCGAWNFDAGAIVAFAAPGAVLAEGFEIGSRTIRGVTSHGMICSERELGLGDDHEGILVLDPGTEIGVDFAGLVERPDTVFDLSITPNRPDCMSMLGIARELAAYYEIPHRVPPTDVAEVDTATKVTITIEDPTGCYRFVGREVTDVTVGPSPLWMRLRLQAAGVRPISNVVDVSNYVMLELGQPLHTFDLDKVADETIIVRRARPGERLRTLDGVDRELHPDDLVVADPSGPSALAGTMGGEHSEVSETTTRVLIEAAAWDPPTVMHMSKRHALRSEASARFERGVDPNLAPTAAARAARLIVEIADGVALGGVQDVIAVPKEPWVVKLTAHDVTRVLGPGFDRDLIGHLLGRLGLVAEPVGPDGLAVTIPTFRPDLTRPIDLVEEVARLWGYDRFDETVPFGKGGAWSPEQRREQVLRRTLTGAGLYQAVPLSFMRVEDLDALGVPDTDERRAVIRLKNPLRDEESALRTTLLPGLLRAARYNVSHGNPDVALFEIGKVFFARPSPEHPRIPDQPDRLGFVLVGTFGPTSLGRSPRPVDVFVGTALWRLLGHHLDLADVEMVAGTLPGLHPGRTAALRVAERTIGHIGELHPAAARAFELPGRVVVGEIDLAPLLAPRPAWQFVEPSVYPPVTFDLAFVVPEQVPAAKLVKVTCDAAGELVEDARVFDEFRGEAIGEERKSLAVTYVLRAGDRTLSGDEAAEVRQAMIEAARRELGAELRGET